MEIRGSEEQWSHSGTGNSSWIRLHASTSLDTETLEIFKYNKGTLIMPIKIYLWS